MASLNKFNVFVKNLIDGVHDFDGHSFKLMLTNTAPIASNEIKAHITEISAGNGYTAGGAAITITTDIAGGTAKVTGTDVTWTASGGGIGPFRYVVLYNDTPTSPADPLIGWWDYGESRTKVAGETFVFDADATNGLFTLT